MIDSRDIADLHPFVAELCRLHLQKCKGAGIDLIVTSTYRDAECQDRLYAQGRTKPGQKVTNARGGFSYHNFRVAYDVVPLRHGKPVWGTTGDDFLLWTTVGEFGEALGLEWAGRWTKFREFPHFQYTGGLTLADFRAGRQLAISRRIL